MGVPHLVQNVRVACSDDLKLVSSPATSRNDAGGTVNHATNGAAPARRQIEQWQPVEW